MIISQGRLSFPRFDAKKFTDALRDLAEAQVRQAAREWLRAVIPKVPVFTGTARGTLMPLGRLIRVAVPISPKAVRPNRGPGVGASLTTGRYFYREGNRFYFRFNTDVSHFIYNNLQPAPDPPFRLINETPWYATQAGNEAFNRYLAEELPKRAKLLRLRNFIKFESISYG